MEATHQRTFDHLRTEQRGPRASRPPAIVRELAHADARDTAEQSAEGRVNPVQDAALRRLRELLCEFLAGLGVNATFQAVNFTAWLDQTGQRPAPGSGVDLRCLGGMWSGLLRNGFIVAIGHQPDGGNPATKHNSASRPIFRIARIPTP